MVLAPAGDVDASASVDDDEVPLLGQFGADLPVPHQPVAGLRRIMLGNLAHGEGTAHNGAAAGAAAVKPGDDRPRQAEALHGVTRSAGSGGAETRPVMVEFEHV